MKPTKEQLADPKWWDENADPRDEYCYMDKTDGECFTTWNFNDWVHGFELLAKRPEQWVPEVGEWYEVESDIRNVWKKAMYVGVDSVGSHVFDVEKRHLWRIDSIGTLVRPIKTRREELIDIIAETYMNANAQRTIADAILARFDLTEKDDN